MKKYFLILLSLLVTGSYAQPKQGVFNYDSVAENCTLHALQLRQLAAYRQQLEDSAVVLQGRLQKLYDSLATDRVWTAAEQASANARLERTDMQLSDFIAYASDHYPAKQVALQSELRQYILTQATIFREQQQLQLFVEKNALLAPGDCADYTSKFIDYLNTHTPAQ